VVNAQQRLRRPWRAKPRNIAFGASLLVACAVATQLAAAGTSAATANEVLVIDNVYNNRNMDPQRESSSSANIALHVMYDRLVTFKGTNYEKVLPSLATSWKVSSDNRSITFTLRKDVVFSDGTPLTAKDVAFSYARLVNLKVTNSSLLSRLTLRTTGKYQVVLTSDTPNPALLRITANPALGVVNRKALAAHGGTAARNAATADTAELWVTQNSAGSGPYMMKQYVPGQSITLVTNPRYWGPKPRFKTVVIRNLPTAAQLLNVQRGKYEVAVDISPTDAAGLDTSKSVDVIRGLGGKIFYMTVNTKPGVTVASNPQLLEAIRFGLDYNGIISLGGPESDRLAGMVPLGLLGALPSKNAVKRDLPRARQLVSQWVAQNGGKAPRFDVSYVTDFSFAGISHQAVAQKVQASLQQVGFDVNLVGRPIATHLAVRAALGLEVNTGLQSMNYPDPNNFLVDYCPGGSQARFLAYQDPVMTELCNRASSTVDDKKRSALLIQYQNRVNRVGPYIPIMQPPAILVASCALTGVEPNAIWNLDVARIGFSSGKKC
jgi:peptide/nickel transport system substrate-binding protein